MAKKAKRMRAYRLPDETIAKIEELAEAWECTQAEVISRALVSDTLTSYVTGQELEESRTAVAVLRTVENKLRADPEIVAATEGRIYRARPFKPPLLKPNQQRKGEE